MFTATEDPILIGEEEVEDVVWDFDEDLPCLPMVENYRRLGKKVSPKARKMLLNSTVQSLLQEAKSIASKGGIITKKTSIVHYTPGSEIDLESTLENLLATGTYKMPTYWDMRSRKVTKIRRCFVVLADKSNSLGPTIDYVALAVSILAEAVHAEEFSVLFFDDRVKEVKSMDSHRETGDILEEVLNVQCFGATDMYKAFEAASNQLALTHAGMEGICVVVSDCIPTTGPDPIEAAGALPNVEVLYVRNDDAAIGKTCIDDLETLPNVMVREISELTDIIESIQDIVSFGSLEALHE